MGVETVGQIHKERSLSGSTKEALAPETELSRSVSCKGVSAAGARLRDPPALAGAGRLRLGRLAAPVTQKLGDPTPHGQLRIPGPNPECGKVAFTCRFLETAGGQQGQSPDPGLLIFPALLTTDPPLPSPLASS